MICSVNTMGIQGIRGSYVRTECYISNGLPGFDIVGLPDAAVKEARERVRAAAKNSGLPFPQQPHYSESGSCQPQEDRHTL